MLSRVMANNILTSAAAEEYRIRASNARIELVAGGESAMVDGYSEDDLDGNLGFDDEARLYNALVPVFFR